MPDTYFEVMAILSEYAGNHERELTAWAFGAVDEYGSYEGPERPHAEAMAWAYDPDGMEGTLTQFPHEEYGLVWQELDNDPEWLRAKHAEDPNQNYYGQGVVWRLAEAPTDEQWEALRAALDSFEVEPKSYRPNPPKVTVERLTLTRVETVRSRIRTED